MWIYLSRIVKKIYGIRIFFIIPDFTLLVYKENLPDKNTVDGAKIYG